MTTHHMSLRRIHQLDHYLEEKVCPPDMDLDILAWWKTNGLKYPMLQRIARDQLVQKKPKHIVKQLSMTMTIVTRKTI
ncbi:putative HAT dimerization domain, ribonuclease H-like superfamily [Helianthus annuus]|uniref:HAT dimerization domain, ribonuclease H-like superfamily n=1 Tax=Helianthus annuus TaxID=4232 RepID=A0A9K3H7G2_HELAN|nr:putative HAT dimerization domain, ribonuclease H-like superfamily [Helianthus annuus]